MVVLGCGCCVCFPPYGDLQTRMNTLSLSGDITKKMNTLPLSGDITKKDEYSPTVW